MFCDNVERQTQLYVGSIKSNIGHLEATSGIAGLLKSVLVLKNSTIPPNLDFQNPKPSLRLHERKLKVCSRSDSLILSAHQM
jgi:acyl transferase domain-containing protein